MTDTTVIDCPAGQWTLVSSGLITSTVYSLQNRGGVAINIGEFSAPPALDTQAHRVPSGEFINIRVTGAGGIYVKPNTDADSRVAISEAP